MICIAPLPPEVPGHHGVRELRVRGERLFGEANAIAQRLLLDLTRGRP